MLGLPIFVYRTPNLCINHHKTFRHVSNKTDISWFVWIYVDASGLVLLATCLEHVLSLSGHVCSISGTCCGMCGCLEHVWNLYDNVCKGVDMSGICLNRSDTCLDISGTCWTYMEPVLNMTWHVLTCLDHIWSFETYVEHLWMSGHVWNIISTCSKMSEGVS